MAKNYPLRRWLSGFILRAGYVPSIPPEGRSIHFERDRDAKLSFQSPVGPPCCGASCRLVTRKSRLCRTRPSI
jgi:hypothetical protein